tara:strand:+ start:1437 stop:1796 length:360 start_codon:yes stop_codon:yes gene_type:complete
MPFFFSDAELAAGWVRNGRPEEEAPEAPLMMDIRTLVGAMQQDASVRAKAAIVTSPEAYQLASEIIAQQKASSAGEAGGDDAGGGGGDAGGDDAGSDDAGSEDAGSEDAGADGADDDLY